MTLETALNCSAKSGAKRTRCLTLIGRATIGCLLFLAACGEQPQGLDEQVTRLQKELDRTQGELQSTTQALQASKEELAQLKANAPGVKRGPVSPTPISSTIPSREALEASYMAEAKALKKQLQSQLKDFTLGSFTLHNVQLPDSQFPITSWISLTFQASGGKQFPLHFVVKADAKGGWVFPETAEIVRRAADAKRIAETPATSENRETKTAPQEPQPNAATIMPADGTVVIQWPDSPSSPPARDTTKSAEPPARPNSQATPEQNPKQTIPADRDVLIRF